MTGRTERKRPDPIPPAHRRDDPQNETRKEVYGNYESGKREPDYETLLKLGEYFNCSIDYLLGSSRGVRYPLLSEFERNLLEQYRSATPAIQSAVCKLLDLNGEA